MTWCKHFRSMAEGETCKAGVTYKDVGTTENMRPGHNIDFPCFNPAIKTCPLQNWPTPEEIAAEEARVNEAIRQFLTDLASDICPHCHTPITSKRQVGRCVYADPCGHRLYQGKLK